MSERASNILAGENKPTGVEAGALAFEDTSLVERVRKGDMQAYGLLVAKYQDRVFNMIYRMCSRRSDAEELAQETFLRALERIRQFRGQSGFYTWLFRIAANLTISHHRRAGRVKFQSMTAPPEYDGTQAEALTAKLAERRSASPQASAISAENAERISAALMELGDEYRLVVILRDIEDMDYANISHVLNVPVGTIKSRLHRARCMLKEKLADLVSQS